MRGITELSKATTAAVALCALAIGCSKSPTSPNASASPVAATSAAATGQAAPDTWQFYDTHGWNCRVLNGGAVVVCSPPGQPLPVPAFPPAVPPADRPPTVMLKRWINGVFQANVHLIRPELYQGQLCQPPDQLYVWAPVLGYYECAHPPIE
jgi:hypothetical protein